MADMTKKSKKEPAPNAEKMQNGTGTKCTKIEEEQ